MSLQRALIGSLLLVIVLVAALMGTLGALSIVYEVRQEAQERVNDDLRTLWTRYGEDANLLLRRIEQAAEELDFADEQSAARLARLAAELELTALNVAAVDGTPIAGDDRAGAGRAQQAVPIEADPVLRRARGGESLWSTVQLDWGRVAREIGEEEARRLMVSLRQPTPERDVAPALFLWMATPIRDDSGAVTALLYGGRALNRNAPYVATLRDLVFGTTEYRDKPLGTVTIFAGPVRVATNVVDAEGRPAIGTTVSDEVRRHVLGRGRIWTDRAWVVDAWYVSAYRPLRDPEERIVGMLYAGLLDAPYVALRNTLLTRFALIVAGGALLAVVVATVVVRRITQPLESLTEAANHFQDDDDWSRATLPTPRQSFTEIATLQRSLAEARDGILERDRRLTQRNETLRQTNEELERVNRNYMQTLRFVTHELKSPLAAMQSMLNLMLDGYLGTLPEKLEPYLRRVSRNCEELQDMVKNYLDLSRVERGELVAHMDEADCLRDVVEPCVEQLQPLFRSRNVELCVDCSAAIDMRVDAGLVRVALSNYLSNAAKYGKEGGRAHLTVAATDDRVEFEVWNEGAGFSEEEAKQLFQQFSRLKNENTRTKKGSGVGLFLCKHIAEVHGGGVAADSEPGQWARFTLSLPRYVEAPRRQPEAPLEMAASGGEP